ncbi:protein KRI1 homolog [Brevipalpus obovatus]|uniref:protein KRI1 homolog n=1 Tax=Brevipalpus obovatus TaxID=246614 RepID=UPI003D9EBE23
MPRKLLESDSEDDGEVELKVNELYADSYQRWRQKEEYQKLKDKYGENIISSDSAASDSEDDSDDSDDEEEETVPNNTVFDEAFFKVYGALKRRDPCIYDEKATFFPEKLDTNGNQPIESASTSKDDKKKRKGMNLMEYHTMLVEKRDGVTEEDEQNGDQIGGRKVYSREMEDLKQEFKSFLNDDDGDEDGQESLIKAKKSSESAIKNDPTPRKVLDDANDEHVNFLKGFWKKKDLDEKEEFLKSYILEKKYLDHDQRMPIPSSSRKTSTKQDEASESSEEDDEPSNKRVKLVDNNNSATNSKISTMEEVLKEAPEHHFLEEDAEVIKRYPRNVESIRNLRESSAKSKKRAEVKARKKKEKEEALQRFRLLKRAEISEKLKKLAEISGNKKLAEKKIDIDLLVDDLNDFDPQKYDERMQQLFGDDYYGTEEDKTKPQFEYIPGIDDDADEMAEDEGESSKSKKKKNKKKSQKELDKNDPTKKKNIGIYDDIVGDQPTRFKYRQVPPNDFGLTPEELLLADDKELNKWVSLTKTCQYRPIEEEKYDQKVYERKKNNTYLKKKAFKSLYSEEATQSKESSGSKK